MKKKLLVIMLVAALSIGFTGCGEEEKSSSAKSSSSEVSDSIDEGANDAAAEEDVEAEAADTELDAAVQELANTLDGTLWVGMDADYACYALGFNGTYAVLAGNDGSSIEGYWAVDDTTLYLYEDEAWETELAQIPWDFDLETETLILNNTAIMAQSDEYSFEDAALAMEQMAAACQVTDYLADTYWVALSDGQAEAMCLSGNTVEIISVAADGTTQEGTFIWGLDYNNMYLYDEAYNIVAAQSWKIEEDGSVFYLTDESGTETAYVQCSEEDATDIMAYLIAEMGLE